MNAHIVHRFHQTCRGTGFYARNLVGTILETRGASIVRRVPAAPTPWRSPPPRRSVVRRFRALEAVAYSETDHRDEAVGGEKLVQALLGISSELGQHVVF